MVRLVRIVFLGFLLELAASSAKNGENSSVKMALRGSRSSPASPPFLTLKQTAAKAATSEEAWWQRGGWSMRTVGIASNSLSADSLKAYADDLHTQGTYVLTIQAAYDSGLTSDSPDTNKPYDPSSLWGGLAINHLDQPSQALGADGIKAVVQHVHDLGMKIMTWINLSYMWTGSPLFEQAEADLKECVDKPAGELWSCLPDGSPAKYFKWSEPRGDCNSGLSKPSNSDPQPAHDWTPCSDVGDKDYSAPCWVYDAVVDRCYVSNWAGQPSGDFASADWRTYVQTGLQHWLDQGFDGFVLDAPNVYIWQDTYAWHKPEGLKDFTDAITTYVRDNGKGAVATFAEVYDTPEFGWKFQLDGNLAGQGDWAGGTAIAEAILAQGGSDAKYSIEDGFRVFDSTMNEAYKTDFFSIVWQRQRLLRPNEQVAGHDGFYPSANVAQIALTAAGGFFSAVEFLQDGSNFADDDAESWWTSDKWGGQGDEATNEGITNLNQFMLGSDAFRHLSLRAPSAPTPTGVYAMIRYDALNSGAVGVFAANLQSDDATYAFEDAFSDSVVKRFSGTAGKAQLEPAGGSFDYTDGVSLPTWSKLLKSTGEKSLNCYDGAGSDDNLGQYKYFDSDTMTFGACLLCCISNSECSSVTVKWIEKTGQVYCWGKGAVDAEACDDSDEYYASFVMN